MLPLNPFLVPLATLDQMTMSRKDLGGTCPDTPEAQLEVWAYGSRNGTTNEEFLQSSAVWPVEFVALLGWDFSSCFPTPRLPLFLCGLDVRVRIIAVILRAVESERSLTLQMRELYPRSHRPSLTMPKLRFSNSQVRGPSTIPPRGQQPSSCLDGTPAPITSEVSR